MTHFEDDKFSELLNLKIDGSLNEAEERELGALLSRGDGYAAEDRKMERLNGLLTASRVTVRPGFREQVMAGLPPAAWEVRRRGGWGMAAASAALLFVVAMLLVALSGGNTGSAGPVVGLLGAVGGFLRGSMIVGAGLLTASWTGAGLAVGSLLAGSTKTLLAFLAVVVGLDAVFLMLLFGRSKRDQGAPARARSGTGSET